MSGADQGSMALVLGSGGVLGGAFHAGVIKALLDVRGIDARQVNTIVGTSAGAITGALLGAGLHPNDIYRRESGQRLSPAGQRLLGAARARLGPATKQRSTLGFPAAPGLALRAVANPFKVAPGSVGAALLPRGKISTDRIRLLIDTMVEERTTGTWGWDGDPYFKVCAVNLHSGRRAVFDGRGGETLGRAVAASCAVPAVFEPVMIGDDEYLDGGVHSSDNVDVLRREHHNLVVVSSPMSTEQLHDVRSPWHAVRLATRFQTDAEVKRLSEGTEVVVLRPSADDLDAMGPNMLDRSRRAAVALQAYTTAVRQLES